MKKIILVVAALIVTTATTAADIIVLNTGSKTGTYSVESDAYAKDLANKHSVKFVSPGQHCAAFAILSKSTTPILFPWASDWEAAGRDGEGCATVPFKDAEVVRYNTSSMHVCAIDKKFTAAEFVKKGVEAKVGHTTPDYAFARVVQAVNKSFGTNHRPITYNGSGDLKTALINGEVNYGFFTAKWVKEIVAIGGQCHYVTNTEGNNGLSGLNSLDPTNRSLTVGYDTVWLMINADKALVEQIKADVRLAHDNKNSAINTATHNTLNINWKQSPESIRSSWEQAVESLRK
jgi:hypothetical protein